MNETTTLDKGDKQPLFGINYMDWDELTYTKHMKSAYYLEDEDDYSDLLEDQTIYVFDK